MQLALQQARKAAEQHEVPVGAVLVLDGIVLAATHNETETTGNPVAHAEMLCIQQAASKLAGWRLLQCTLYVTLEPCPMCAGALLQSRVGTLVYGARNTLLGNQANIRVTIHATSATVKFKTQACIATPSRAVS